MHQILVVLKYKKSIPEVLCSQVVLEPTSPFTRVDYYGRTVYRPGQYPDEKEVIARLQRYYVPFHTRVKEALKDPNIRGLCDCHSLNGIGPQEAPDAGKKRKDIIVGNNGDPQGHETTALGRTTCTANTLHSVKEAFERAGFSVSLNYPYSGGFITTHYGQEYVSKGKIAFQVEINQDLYVDPASNQLVPERLAGVKSRVLHAFERIGRRL